MKKQREAELARAVLAQDAEAVERLLAAGADPNAATPKRVPLIVQATLLGHSRIVGLLLAHGARADEPVRMKASSWYDPYAELNAFDPDAPPIAEPYALEHDGPGPTALSVAMARGLGEIVEVLCEHGTPLEIDEALREAVRHGRHQIAIELLARGADPHWRRGPETQTAFEIVAERAGDADFVALRDRFSRLAPELAQAVIAQDPEAVERLLSDGASANAMTGEDSHIPGVPGPQRLLSAATVLGDARIVKLLVDHGARVDRRVAYTEYRGTLYVGNAEFEQEERVLGKNALEYAAEAGREDLVRLLSQA